VSAVKRDITAELQATRVNYQADVNADSVEIVILKELLNRIRSKDFPYIILAIDEAKGLFTMTDYDELKFRLFRRALIKMDSATEGFDVKIFAIVCDTSSKLGNFAPPSRLDSSTRNPTVHPRKLHHPFVQISNVDSFFLELAKAGLGPLPEQTFFNLNIFLKIGRPIWGIFLSSGVDVVDSSQSKEALSFAQKKLLGGKELPDFDPKKDSTELLVLALLNIRVPLAISRQGQLVETMSALYMRTIISISEDRELVHGNYIAEPILALAAQKLSEARDEFMPINSLRCESHAAGSG
jgi:hypothetical protein